MRKPKLIKSEDDLSKALATLFKGSYGGRNYRVARHGTRSSQRTDIISESLCKDIIAYIGPSLQKHKGCTLIDLNPGACVWSKALHDFLKPKRHLLIEPDERYFESFIRPLLKQPNSTYRHTFFDGRHPHQITRLWRSLEDDRSLLPPRAQLARDYPGQKVLDPSVLVTGNYARKYPVQSYSYSNRGSTSYALSRIAYDTLQDECFHASGRVRMLWWFSEEHKQAALPISLKHKFATSVGLDMGLTTTEIAGVTPYPAYGMRSTFKRFKNRPLLDEHDQHNVVIRMESSNTTIPRGRELLTSDIPTRLGASACKSWRLPSISLAAALDEKIGTVSTRLKEVEAMCDRLSSRLSMAKFTDMMSTLQYPHVYDAIDTLVRRSLHGLAHKKATVLADLALQVLNLEANFCSMKEKRPDDPDVESLRGKIIQVSDDLHDIAAKSAVTMWEAICEYIEDEIALHVISYPLSRLARPFEPLKASSENFWPPGELTLLDMNPKTRNLAVPDLASQDEASRFCYILIQHLFNFRRNPLPVALDKLAINAGADLIPMVPRLTDVRKGGRLNPMRLTARMLTDDMIADLVKAFFEWPFRPENWETTLNFDTSKALTSSLDRVDDGEVEEGNIPDGEE